MVEFRVVLLAYAQLSHFYLASIPNIMCTKLHIRLPIFQRNEVKLPSVTSQVHNSQIIGTATFCMAVSSKLLFTSQCCMVCVPDFITTSTRPLWFFMQNIGRPEYKARKQQISGMCRCCENKIYTVVSRDEWFKWWTWFVVYSVDIAFCIWE